VNRRIEFTIGRVTTEEGRALVDGRNCDAPMRIGDIFTRVYGQRQKWDGTEWVAVGLGPTHSVRLVIQSIESYRRIWDELSPGMTARLTITGDGLAQLSEGRILGD
jgi:hypothetical protein